MRPSIRRPLPPLSLLACAALTTLAVACGGEAPDPTAATGGGAVPMLDPAAEALATAREAAPPIVLEMVEAHGGYDAWAAAPTVSFEDSWDGGTTWARVVVEQGPRRATIDYLGSEMAMAWDGTQAWSVSWEAPMPPRFLALLNYYFLNLPWLTLDPGVRLEDTGTKTIFDDPTEYRTVMMTFEDGIGDTPDDFYELYIHPETKRLHANRYIVTYEALLPEGAEQTPDKILIYDEWTTVEGLLVPAAFTIRAMDGSDYARCAIRNWSFSEPFDESRMTMPEDATVDTSQP